MRNARPARGQRRDEATQRLANGGYTDAELDAALLRSQRSDPLAVALRLLTLGLVYGVLARAVAAGLASPYLLLPMLAELLLIFWLGWLLSRSVVRCPAFRRSAGSGLGVAVWSALILAVALGWVAWDPLAGEFSLQDLKPRAAAAFDTTLQHGLHWALLAMLVGLLAATVGEVAAWRRSGGVFVWTSITTAGTRIGLLVLLGMVAALAAGFLAPLWQGSGLGAWLDQRLAWLVWSILLVLDLGVVVVLALMHRDLRRRAGL